MSEMKSTNGDDSHESNELSKAPGFQVEWVPIGRVFGNPANPRIKPQCPDCSGSAKGSVHAL